jgi:TolB-like protein/DNA-binding winged helix-turn-helix (wHTH) protein/Tfp pilus assembly protein PilF
MKAFLSFRLDAADHSLWRGEERAQITPKAFDVLRHLVENAGRLVTQDELLEALWKETYVNPEVLRKYILEIRRVLGDRPNEPQYIETVTKRGYRFIAPVTEDNVNFAEASPLASTEVEQRSSVTDTPAPKLEVSSGTDKRRKLIAVAVALLSAVGAVSATGYFWFSRSKTNIPSSRDSSIAVLPFIDMSPGKDQEYFSDGLTEELINDLAQVRGLKVVARSSAFQFKGKNEDLRAVGRKLGVANVLEGSVRKEGNHIRITAELVKAEDGFQLWSETYDREIGGIFATQEEIAGAVSGALQLKLLSASGAAITSSSRTANSKAYEAYLQGQYFSAKGQDKEDLKKALTYANQATELDPNYAPAWAQRAQALQSLSRIALIEPDEGFRAARESAKKAISLDPNLTTGYLALGLVQVSHDWDWEGADSSFRKAAQLEPGSAAVLSNRAYLARHLGRLDETVDLYTQAIALDPLRANAHLSFGYVRYLADQFDEAKAELQKAEDLNPRLSGLHLTRGQVLLLEGHPQEALNEIEQETGDWDKLSGEALAYHALGNRREADKALAKLIAMHQNDAAYQIAEAYAFRGETEKAFQWMDRAIRQRDPGAPEFRSNPLMKSLRQDSRWAGLSNKMHLPSK